MLGIEYFKAEPTEFARIRSGGKVSKEGEGITGIYLPFRTTIEMISTSAKDHPVSFPEISQDSQELTFQGRFLYRVSDPLLAMKRYNFSIDPKSREYQTDDNRKLPEHILNLVRAEAKKVILVTPLEKLVVMGEELADRVKISLVGNEIVRQAGIEFNGLYFDSITPKPEISKAREAPYREGLLQTQDEAVFKRRAQAVEKERTIKENEMRTLTEMEQKRTELVKLEGANIVSLADYKAQAIAKELTAYQGVEPRMIVAQALLRMGENAGKIGNLTITPEILSGIMDGMRAAK